LCSDNCKTNLNGTENARAAKTDKDNIKQQVKEDAEREPAEDAQEKIEEEEPAQEEVAGGEPARTAEDTKGQNLGGELSEGERIKEELENVRRQLEEQTALAQEYFNRLARMKADFENFRRRSQREREELVRYAAEQLMKSLLPVLDNFERALADESGELDKFKEGIKMIYNQICEILAGEGLEPIPAEGEEFNPEKHEAVMSEESSEHPDNTVLEELRKGYTLKGKVIRPAMVKVAKSNS